jgi:phage shock protein PspC (stress-responsive transcriptional regulator)
MKKVEKVSIAEIAFTLDSDAYISLKQYLDSLYDYYDKDPDGREIARDIEARIAELILDEQVYTKVVSKALIDTIIAQLGTPDQIDGEAGEDEGFVSAAGAASGGSTPEASIPRRLHRSAEGQILGGVCSGIARFLDVNVAWVRLVFLAPIMFRIFASPFHGEWFEDFAEGWSGVFFLTYIVLWIALPIAKTPRQKLEARGEKITSASIRRSMQETAHTPAGKKAASVAAELITVLGRVMLFFVKFVMAIIGFSLLFAALWIFIAMMTVLINPASVSASIHGVHVFSMFEGMVILSPVLFTELALLCAMLPLFVIGMAMLSFTFSWRLGRVFYGVTLGTWGAAMIFLGIVAAGNARLFHDIPDRIERWDDRHDGDRWEQHETVRESMRDADGVNVDLSRDSLVIVVKKDGTANDTIKITPDGLSVSAAASDSIPTGETAPATDGRRRVEIRRVE